MPDDVNRATKGILGDINPSPSARDHQSGYAAPNEGAPEEHEGGEPAMAGGSQHDRAKHPGSREVTEGTTGGAEVGGTRNYRTGTGATGSDIGNRPE